jgi:hypothetical protein
MPTPETLIALGSASALTGIARDIFQPTPLTDLQRQISFIKWCILGASAAGLACIVPFQVAAIYAASLNLPSLFVDRWLAPWIERRLLRAED